MSCPVCRSPYATVRAENLQVRTDCCKCGGPFVLTHAAARKLGVLTPEQRKQVSACIAREKDERRFTESFIDSFLRLLPQPQARTSAGPTPATHARA